MKINKEIISKLNPCKDRFNNYVANYQDREFNLKQFIQLDQITYSDKVWVVTRLFTDNQNVLWSIFCAESTLHIFEKQCPQDHRPALALSAAKAYLQTPTEAARAAGATAGEAARAAARAAGEAAWAAREAARAAGAAAGEAARAAREAAWAAAGEAAWAARAAGAAAGEAARAAGEAARAAAGEAAWAARAAGEKEQETKNLSFMLLCLENFNENKN